MTRRGWSRAGENKGSSRPMSSYTNASPRVKGNADTAGERELMIHSLRLAVAKSRLITNSLETVGVSLRHKAISVEDAMKWLAEEGLLSWLEFAPPQKVDGAA
jgi:hypothetical protein